MTLQITQAWSIILFSGHLHGLIVIDWSPPSKLDMKTLHLICWRPKDWLQWGYDKDWYDGPWQEYRLGPLGGYFWRW